MSGGPDEPPETDATADPDADPDAEPPENDPPDRPMSTDTIDATAATDQPDDRSGSDEPGPDDTGADTRDLVRYARYALLGGLTLLALVATLRFYFAASNAIDIWVARQYRPLFQAAFNLVVLLVAAVGISWEIRKVAG
jgi:hypothetical protein